MVLHGFSQFHHCEVALSSIANNVISGCLDRWEEDHKHDFEHFLRLLTEAESPNVIKDVMEIVENLRLSVPDYVRAYCQGVAEGKHLEILQVLHKVNHCRLRLH